MKAVRPRLLPTLLLLCLLPLTLGAGERQAKEAELAKLRQRINSLRGEMEVVRGRYDSLRQELRKTERTIGKLAASLRRLKRQLGEQADKLTRLNGERRQLEASVAGQRGRLEQQIRAAYMTGRQEYLKILLNQEEPATLGRVITYYDYLNRARTERIETLLGTLRELETVRHQIDEETARIEALQAQRQAEKKELEKSRAERGELLAQLKQELQSKDQQLERMLKDEKELERLILALAEALEDIPAEPGNHRPFDQLKGKLHWPTKGKQVARYGTPRELSGLNWQGVMIQAGEGAEVRAVSHGRVAFADWLRGYGLLLIIDHGNGYMSLYGRNQTLYKETGDWVETGEVIAAVGNTGGHERNGLYFEIRKDGKPTNPSRWCRLAAR